MVNVKLSVRNAEGAWLVSLKFVNNGKDAAPLYLPNLLVGSKIHNDVFTITADGRAVPYTGAYVKRSAPKRDDFLLLAAGTEVGYEASLSEVYAIPTGRRKIMYRAFHGDVSLWGGIFELRSNEATF